MRLRAFLRLHGGAPENEQGQSQECLHSYEVASVNLLCHVICLSDVSENTFTAQLVFLLMRFHFLKIQMNSIYATSAFYNTAHQLPVRVFTIKINRLNVGITIVL